MSATISHLKRKDPEKVTSIDVIGVTLCDILQMAIRPAIIKLLSSDAIWWIFMVVENYLLMIVVNLRSSNDDKTQMST